MEQEYIAVQGYCLDICLLIIARQPSRDLEIVPIPSIQPRAFDLRCLAFGKRFDVLFGNDRRRCR